MIELVDIEPDGDMVFKIEDTEIVVTEEMEAMIEAEMAKLSDSQLEELTEVVEEDLATASALPAIGGYIATIVGIISVKVKLSFFQVSATCIRHLGLCTGILNFLFRQGPRAVNCARRSIQQRRWTC